MKLNPKLCVLALLVLDFGGCFRQEPEGPAEMIGKGIDQIAQGVKDLDDDSNLSDYERRRRAELRRRRESYDYDNEDYNDQFANEPFESLDNPRRY